MLEEKTRRYQLMDARRNLVKTGQYLEAQTVLQLLREGYVKLGLCDADFNVELLCEKMECNIHYSWNGHTATVRL